VREQLLDVRKVAALPRLFGAAGALLAGHTAAGLQVWMLDAPHLYARKGGGPYLDGDGHDWPDNHLRFGALSWVGAQIAMGRLGGWQPDVVHLHDWQAALTAGYLHFDPAPGARPATLLTIHNLAFQGLFGAGMLPALGLPAGALDVDGMEYWGNLSFLKAGVRWADHLSTVSPTYAREIRTVEHGMGFDGLLRARPDGLTGIVNGIDDAVWNPATDPALVAQYSVRRLHAKATNKAALQAELQLEARPGAPLFCVVSRLSTQKGLDLLLAALPPVAGTWRAAGRARHRRASTGGRPASRGARPPWRRRSHHRLRRAALTSHAGGRRRHPRAFRFEPCGLTQLYGLRYGTLPVVARVGGLADTVIDANEAALRDGVATGFQFSPVVARRVGRGRGARLRPVRRPARVAASRQAGDDPRRRLVGGRRRLPRPVRPPPHPRTPRLYVTAVGR
jgi:starch synthase